MAMPKVSKHASLLQEDLILNCAATSIEESSLLDFTMASIGKKANLSMGSLYKHVQSKEDVLVALSTRLAEHQKAVSEAVMGAPLTMPERLMAAMLLPPEKLYNYSFGVHLQMLTSNEALLRRSSPGWLSKLMVIEEAIDEVFSGTIDRALDSKELRTGSETRETTHKMLSDGLWSLYVGFVQVAYQRQTAELLNIEKPLPFPLQTNDPIIKTTKILINGFDWETPLSDEGIERAASQLEQMNLR
ncbi:TetR/AcrR family transcriptional regulator [Rhodovibrionaceae bacterium A322]